jgi:outer membrane protein OmpA-like peptidoglycan-associated protein
VKKFVAIAGVVSLVSTAAVAREEPTIEINIDVLQGLVPPPAPSPAYVPSVEKLPSTLKAPCKKHKTTKHKKSVRKKAHKKSQAPKVKKELAPIAEPVTPTEKQVKPEVPAITPAPLPSTTEVPAEAPKADVTAPVETSTTPVEAPKEEALPAVALPLTAEIEQSKTDEWLLKAGEWKDKFKQWVADKKEAISPTTPAPEDVKPEELKAVEENIPAVPATDITAEKLPNNADADIAPAENPVVDHALATAAQVPEPTAPAADVAPIAAPVEIKPETKEAEKVESAKQPEPLPIPAEEPVKPEAEAPKPLAEPATPAEPHVEAERLQTEVDALLLKADALKTRFKAWVKNLLEPTPATVTLPAAEEKILPETSAITDIKNPQAVATATVVPPDKTLSEPVLHAADLAKPEAEAKPAVPAETTSVITPPAPPAGIRPAAAGTVQHKADSNLLYTVLFAGAGDEVSEADMASLNALSEKLQQEKETRISVLGSAPRVDGMQESDARKLSLKRAIAVRQLLIKQGIRSDRINVRALGSDTQEAVKDRVDIVKLR